VGHHDFRLSQVPQAVRINARDVADAAAAVSRATGGEGIDAAILAVGTAESAALCLESLRARGRMVVFSSIAQPMAIDLFRLHSKELAILGSCNDEDLLDEALGCLADPALRLDSLITHRIPFRDWRRALTLASECKGEALKVAITFEGAPR
jgi:threonine dehydrogenase-like Zn-dependent dehydrogenase